jgi:hypothetical protein
LFATINGIAEKRNRNFGAPGIAVPSPMPYEVR